MIGKSKLSQIVDVDIQERIEYLGRMASDSAWEVGDLCLLIWDKLMKFRDQLVTGEVRLPGQDVEDIFAIGKMDIYSFVGELYGRSARTIRFYESVASKYPMDLREQYDVLPFSHFEFALEMGDKGIDVLKASVQQMDRNGGKPPSVDWLRANFPGIGQVDQAIDQLDFMDEISEGTAQAITAGNHLSDPPEPGEPNKEKWLLRVVAGAIRPLERFVGDQNLPGPVASALKNLIDALREALYETTT